MLYVVGEARAGVIDPGVRLKEAVLQGYCVRVVLVGKVREDVDHERGTYR